MSSRVQAGRMLAAKIAPRYQGTRCVVLALDDGGAMIGAQISRQLHSPLMMLSSAEIMLPREPQAIAGITDSGVFSYNHSYSPGEIDEMVSEYFNLIEQEKLTEMHVLNHMQVLGKTTSIELIRHSNVILVSEGLKTGFKLDLAREYLKPIKINKIVVAVPIASVLAVDIMHILADDLYCLSVVSDFMEPDHYYDKQDVPDHQTVVNTISDMISKWQ